MQRCKLELNLTSIINFRMRENERETAEELIEDIKNGYVPGWIEILIKRGLQYDQVEVVDFSVLSHEPAPEEELNFEY